MELRFNMKMFVICLYPLCCLLLMSSVHDVAGQCTMRGRFGANCRYQCHCELGSDDCNRTTGVCSIGQACASGYYGNNCQNQNVALKKPAHQSSIYAARNGGSYVSYSANFAVDGISSTNFDSNPCAHTQEKINSWWYVDLGREYNIRYLRVYNRQGFQWRLQGFEVRIGNYIAQHASFLLCYRHPNTTPSLVIDVACNSVMRGRYVRINLGSRRDALTLCEVQVFVCTLYSFGANCTQTCNCKLANDVCNTVTGNCSSGCAAGFQGEDCKAACDNNRYGDSCASPCNANCILSSGSRTCHHLTGHCSNGCQSGYQGGFCNTACDNNRYGDSCASSCNANCILSYGSRTCHHVTGHCRNGCQSGYQGDFCNTACDIGKYGNGCRWPCYAECLSSSSSGTRTCDHETGHCVKCRRGYQGHFCTNECRNNKYGDRCATTCNANCRSSSSSRGQKCHHVTGSCSYGCQPGYQGSFCNTECDINRYGDRCASSCNANCILSSGSRTCQHVRGHCSNGCQSGYQGDFCNTECDINRYGDYCSSACNDNCMLSPGRRTCEHATGHCRNGCQPGYQGRFCNTVCTGQSFGANCANTCNCKHWNEECNKVTGACSSGCAAGFQGVRCKTKCILDYYGDCRTKCSKHCITIDSGQRQCNFISGDCTKTTGCQPGYIGSKCDQECSLNYYGDCRTNCSEHCITVDGRQRQCNFIYGDCTNTTGCQTGYIGSKCDQECSNVTYGVGCNKNCSDQCIIVPTSERVCSHETGACTSCNPGYNGTNCDQRCVNGYYGDTCKSTCSGNCDSFQNSSADICDYISGRCLSGCTPGYQGNMCTEVCDSARYGFNCSGICNKNCQPTDNGSSICHHVSGNCTSGCRDGYIASGESICTIYKPIFKEPASDTSGGKIAGIAIGCLIAIALIAALLLIFIIRRRKARVSKETDQNGARTNSALYIAVSSNASSAQRLGSDQPDIVVSNETAVDISASDVLDDGEVYYNDLPLRTLDANEGIAVSDLWDYVVDQKGSGGLKAEYEKLPAGLVHAANAAVKPENKGKSRYLNIYAYDHTRILLDVAADSTHTDYINANYVSGYQNPKKYIASQGPNAITMDDFWRMVWQENCSKIVSLTRLVESGRMKCDQYWPDSGSKDYGNIIVKMIQVDDFADFTIRTLQVKHTQSPDKRLIKQFHFMAWPDHGVPDYATELVSFRAKVAATNASTTGPIVIHCSAGIGRTGTYISLEFLIEQAKAEGRVDIFGCIKVMRYYRVNMIQTAEQYEFLHDALLEALNLSDLSTPSYEFMDKYINLKKVNSRSGKTYLQEQFELLNLLSPSDNPDDFTSAKLPENTDKHRDCSVMAAENHRVYLATPIADTSNYINAVFLPGYKEPKAFIITQTPLPSTVIDFWRMIYENKCRTIVTLNDDNTLDGAAYWSNDGTPQTIGPFTITSKLDVDGGLHNTISLELTYGINSEDVLKIQLFQCKFWLESEKVPSDASLIITVLEDVEHWQQRTRNTTIVVHCTNGAERSGVYCTISAVIDRLKIEQHVNISQTIKQLRIRRPQIINSMEQYQLCHDAVISYLENFQTYSNFK